ncbi:cupin domain-containing protein [Pandoraea commovens]|uniref:Cupin domain-containing protein n=1 Tax=Pandoraea commovens TaxID=2508289 RepID=A0A5E4RPU8_9BURK|nr:cupin domain-containing protein [Pandoraea commovens]UVA77216.1 cupin domain-containing protein [Pandoraea commovens]VVD64474.1 ferredoxin [Pandoraea commovens]
MNAVASELSGSANEATTTDEGKPVTWHVDDAPWIPLTGLFINRSGYKTVTDAAYTGNAYSIELTSVGAGGSSPTHVEPHAHLFYVLSGHGEVSVGEEVTEVRAGSVSPISAGMPHSFRNLGDDALEMLVVYHPPRVRKPVTGDQADAEPSGERASVERVAPREAPAERPTDYEVELRRSGRTLEVKSSESLLQTLLDAGVEVSYGCMQGMCGECKTRVLEGEPDHRDSVLTRDEQASGEVMTICVSGCKSGKLVLDL